MAKKKKKLEVNIHAEEDKYPEVSDYVRAVKAKKRKK